MNDTQVTHLVACRAYPDHGENIRRVHRASRDAHKYLSGTRRWNWRLGHGNVVSAKCRKLHARGMGITTDLVTTRMTPIIQFEDRSSMYF